MPARVDVADLARRGTELLERLIGFDTTSRDSNLALIEFVENYLGGHGVASRRIVSPDGAKANLLASVGPPAAGGIVLSGHTDVVPVDGQPWTSDPFTLTRRGDKLFGRGTCDMKGFIALALAAVPDLVAARPARPAHLALSYDEEVGCLGAPRLIAEMARDLPAPALVIVGEPTSSALVGAHKGISLFEVIVRGREAHSSQTHLGVSAVMAAVRLMSVLDQAAARLEAEAEPHSPFVPPHATLTIGIVHGGTAGNILARECRFLFDVRAPAGADVGAMLRDFFSAVKTEDAAIRSRCDGGVEVIRRADVPGFSMPRGGPAEALARRLTGDNGEPGAVSFAAEAGQFGGAGFPTVLCGPGSIDQAHQPDEFIAIEQMERGAALLAAVVAELT
ncbi:MAG TPA: acetylornithine deacetylase [Caulobacteraceae bacterium]|jgi:acetylornithine deacetylase|nr:acetylornithine deacetylase [Caulobacteraceae bacterium]